MRSIATLTMALAIAVPVTGEATVTDCVASETTALTAGCKCASSSPSNDCSSSQYCYDGGCYASAKYTECAVSDTTELTSACKCAQSSSGDDCPAGKFCYDGACNSAAKSSSSTDCTPSETQAQSSTCKCAAESTTDECASGQFCYGGACQASAKVDPCTPSDTEPLTAACQCASDSSTNECASANFCYDGACYDAAKETVADCVASDSDQLTAACKCASGSSTNDCASGQFCYDSACYAAAKVSDCTVTGLSAPSNGALDTACLDQSTLATGASCVLTCNTGYAKSGTQPSCSKTVFSTGSVTCTQSASCTVTGLSAPTNGALDTACKDQSTLAGGASCALTCNTGYSRSGTQPSCSSGAFSVGSVSCSESVTDCIASDANVLTAACKCAANSASDECPSGKYCYDQTCNAAAKGCTVTGLSAPANGALDKACADQANLAYGASCTLTCSAGHALSGTQPSCSSTGIFSTGSVKCAFLYKPPKKAATKTIAGGFSMTVPDPATFAANAQDNTAVANAVAKMAGNGVLAAQVQVSLIPLKAASTSTRRLDLARRLTPGTVTATYSIPVPPANSGAVASALSGQSAAAATNAVNAQLTALGRPAVTVTSAPTASVKKTSMAAKIGLGIAGSLLGVGAAVGIGCEMSHGKCGFGGKGAKDQPTQAPLQDAVTPLVFAPTPAPIMLSTVAPDEGSSFPSWLWILLIVLAVIGLGVGLFFAFGRRRKNTKRARALATPEDPEEEGPETEALSPGPMNYQPSYSMYTPVPQPGQYQPGAQAPPAITTAYAMPPTTSYAPPGSGSPYRYSAVPQTTTANPAYSGMPGVAREQPAMQQGAMMYR